MSKGLSSSEVPWAHDKSLLVHLLVANWLSVGGAQKLQMKIFSTSPIGRSKSGAKQQCTFPIDTHL